ncbi:universal stress protein [Sphingobium ummariense]|uniref:UspA domain-containing protein n=1 Tax=Sphingobium ummariense RL-3 TaxID=1346791 RepID=T0KB52_9SPHN|nr:universal stress protein [Sphingobium ummariense]EQB30668.1 hypothetical protein M529_18165 [Sphingobium ummariense RL-3]
MRYSTIVVAVDVNDPIHARAAVTRAAAIVDDAGMLHLLHVRYFLPARYSDLLADDFDTREEREAIKAMRGWCAEAGLDESRFRINTRRGRVRDEVIDEAARTGADLIVIGSHQPSIGSYLLGSNAAAIIRHSPVSVLVVRAEPK